MFLRRHNNHIIQKHDIVYQETKINELRAALGTLSGRSLKFCTDPCLRRYLKDRNWNVAKSKCMLEETLRWRSSYKPEEIRWHEVEHEGETGKAYRANFKDRDGRTVLVMRPGKQNTRAHESQLRYTVYILENAILNLPEGQEEIVWLVDFTGWSVNSVPMKTAKATINILQNHYPETLASAFLYNPPRIFEYSWKAVKVFMDPSTVQKMKFVYPNDGQSMEVMKKHFDLDMLPKEFGGMTDIKYDHKEFSKLMRNDDIKMASLWGSAGIPSCESVDESSVVTSPESPSSLGLTQTN